MEKRSPKQWWGLGLRGMAMGAADIVPGVSGGTVAFIVGIYEEFLTTIGGLGLGTVRDLFRDGPVATWRRYNLGFLAALGAGIVTSVTLLAGLLHHLLDEHPVLLWSFFFGLVAASVPLMLREIQGPDRNSAVGGMLIFGACIAWWLAGLPPLVQSDAPLFLFLSGAIAICAMILPGISGSFILILLGAYPVVLGLVDDLSKPDPPLMAVFVRLAAFVGGALGGLLGFTKGLGWVFRRHRALALAFLSGFLIGSLRKLWPWKEQVELLYTHSNGREEWLEANLPWSQHPEPQLWAALSCAVIGAVLVTVLSKLGQRSGHA